MNKQKNEQLAKKAQRTIVEYREKLEGMDLLKADDLLEMIQQAKSIKDRMVKAIENGDADAARWFKPLCDTIVACYDELPATPTAAGEKTGIEKAMEILFGE